MFPQTPAMAAIHVLLSFVVLAVVCPVAEAFVCETLELLGNLFLGNYVNNVFHQ